VCEDAMLCEGVDCDDLNECTEDACDPQSGICDYTPVADDTACDFGGLPGLCKAGVCEDAMLCDGVNCDDLNECTEDACDPQSGICDYTPVADDTACDFGGLPGLCQAGECMARDTTDSLIWPIACVPGEACVDGIGYPDIDGDGLAFDCGNPGYIGHQGTDIGMTWEQMDAGIDVLAAAPGEVLWVFDGKYDRCPNPDEPDCQPSTDPSPGSTDGQTVCTELGDYCGQGTCCCYWCFAGGNVVVIRHTGVQGVFATRYDHFKENSIVVAEGEFVEQGQKIGEAGSAGASSGPHLHFEVWGTGFYQLADPWAGPCGPNLSTPLWAFDPPWAPLLLAASR
jgi:hypothetical protein